MINNEDFSKVVQGKSDYYIPKFENLKENENKESWNFAGFFFSFSWLVYRKMYVEGFVALGIKILLMYIGKYETSVSLIIRLICGVYGNYIYFKHCEKKVNDAMNLDNDIKNNRLENSGGVSIVGLIVVFIIVFVATGIYTKYNPAPY